MPIIRDGPKGLLKPPALKKAKRPRFDEEEPTVPAIFQPRGQRGGGGFRTGAEYTAAAAAIERGGRAPRTPRFDTEGARLGIANQVRFSGAGLPAWYVNRATNQAYQDWVMKRLIGAGLIDVPQAGGGGGGRPAGGGGGFGGGGGDMEPASRLLGHAYGLINWRI